MSKTRSGKSRDYRDAITLEKLRFQTVIRPRENEKLPFLIFSRLKSVFKKHRFHFGLVWTVGLGKKAAFSNSFGEDVWTAGILLSRRLEETLTAVICTPVRTAGIVVKFIHLIDMFDYCQS